MKTPRVVNAVKHIDDDLVVAAAENKMKSKHNLWLRWGSIAACFVSVLVAAIGILPNILSRDEPLPPITSIAPNNSEKKDVSSKTESGQAALEKYYSYEIDEGKFSSYIGGTVIAEEKVGNKIGNVAVTAGWKSSADEWISVENLNAEIYVLNDISEEVAVALMFLDQGEAITTTHYYVIMNPDADLTVVEDYVIAPVASTSNADNEVAQENSTTPNSEETVTVISSTVPNSEVLE